MVAALFVLIAFTAATMIWWWTVAWIPAVTAAVIFLLILGIAELDRRARHRRRVSKVPEAERQRVSESDQWRVGTKTVLVIVIGAAAIALVIASLVLEWRIIGLGALLIFAWMILIGLPIWLATVEDEEAIVHERTTGEEPMTSHGARE